VLGLVSPHELESFGGIEPVSRANQAAANGMVRPLGGRYVSRRDYPMAVHTLGIDLGKNSFHVIGLDERVGSRSSGG
jgi:hypothetical protein